MQQIKHIVCAAYLEGAHDNAMARTHHLKAVAATLLPHHIYTYVYGFYTLNRVTFFYPFQRVAYIIVCIDFYPAQQ